MFDDDVRAQDLAGQRIGEARTISAEDRGGGGDPADYVIAHVAGIPLRIVRLHLDAQGMAQAGGLEERIPGQDGVTDHRPVFQRCGVLDPEGDRGNDVGYGGIGVLFF